MKVPWGQKAFSFYLGSDEQAGFQGYPFRFLVEMPLSVNTCIKEIESNLNLDHSSFAEVLGGRKALSGLKEYSPPQVGATLVSHSGNDKPQEMKSQPLRAAK